MDFCEFVRDFLFVLYLLPQLFNLLPFRNRFFNSLVTTSFAFFADEALTLTN